MLHSVIVSYNRPRLTEQTIVSYMRTVRGPHTLVVVDNGSDQQTLDMLQSFESVIYLGKNCYPGYAANVGFSHAPDDALLLQKIDNDVKFLPGWCDEMYETFENPEVGIYGLTSPDDGEEVTWDVWPCGGNHVIRRSIWDRGIRYDERTWTEGIDCDRLMTEAVIALGFTRKFGQVPGLEYWDDGDWEYRKRTHADRGLVPHPWTGRTL